MPAENRIPAELNERTVGLSNEPDSLADLQGTLPELQHTLAEHQDASPQLTVSHDSGSLYESIALPPLSVQAERLIELGIPERAGITANEIRAHAAALSKSVATAAGGTSTTDGEPTASHEHPLLVIPPSVLPPSRYADLLSLNGKPGFVVVDMVDVDEFSPIPPISPLPEDWYAMTAVNRGDHLSNWSPEEALVEFTAHSRTPLTLNEGMSLLLQLPQLLEPNKCFMTIGSRKRKDPEGKKLDSRTPALWISGGTGRDGKAAKGAPKVGWCWANNRHTWLGFASAHSRIALD